MNTPIDPTTPANASTPKAADAGPIPASLKREPPRRYEVHPIADIFPLLDGPAMEALIDDIRERSQQEPIWLYEGKIIDGRNRYLACQRLGHEARTKDFTGEDPIGFVLGANLHRRHLSESQRAMVAAKLANMSVGNPDFYNCTNSDNRISQGEAAKVFNVSEDSIQRARKVHNEGPLSPFMGKVKSRACNPNQ